MIKFKVKTLDEVEEALQSFYTKRDEDGKEVYVLEVEGAVPKEKVDEFRTGNIAERKKREEAEAALKTFSDLKMTPEEIAELAEKRTQIEAGKLIKSDDLEAAVEKRVSGLIKDHKSIVDSLSGELGETKQQLATRVIDGTVLTIARKFGLRKGADSDIVARAHGIFKMHEGKMTAFEADGKTVKYGKSGVDPLTPEEWMKSQAEDGAKHLFAENSGGGASGGASGGGAISSSIKNPWDKSGGTWNLTNQMKVTKANPKLAARFKADVGVK
jgi:hypothetical protein